MYCEECGRNGGKVGEVGDCVRRRKRKVDQHWNMQRIPIYGTLREISSSGEAYKPTAQ